MNHKYHINPKTGKPALCRANKRPCLLKDSNGNPTEHYSSFEEAQTAFEKVNENRQFEVLQKAETVESLNNKNSKATNTWYNLSKYSYLPYPHPEACGETEHIVGSKLQINCSDTAALDPSIYDDLVKAQEETGEKFDYQKRVSFFDEKLTLVWDRIIEVNGGDEGFISGKE